MEAKVGANQHDEGSLAKEGSAVVPKNDRADFRLLAAVKGQTRLAEIRIGELLGPVTERQRTDLSDHSDSGLSKDQRHEFRRLAWRYSVPNNRRYALLNNRAVAP